jgi:hypothetical protein
MERPGGARIRVFAPPSTLTVVEDVSEIFNLVQMNGYLVFLVLLTHVSRKQHPVFFGKINESLIWTIG